MQSALPPPPRVERPVSSARTITRASYGSQPARRLSLHPGTLHQGTHVLFDVCPHALIPGATPKPIVHLILRELDHRQNPGDHHIDHALFSDAWKRGGGGERSDAPGEHWCMMTARVRRDVSTVQRKKFDMRGLYCAPPHSYASHLHTTRGDRPAALAGAGRVGNVVTTCIRILR